MGTAIILRTTGIAIINLTAHNGLSRTHLNVIPTDSAYRHYLKDVNSVSFSYQDNEDGTYSLSSLNIGNATLPYIYALLDAPITGVSINEINGVITVTPNFSGTEVTVQLKALYDGTYYIKGSNPEVIATTTVQVSAHSDPTPLYRNLSITQFSYSGEVSEAGATSSVPTVTYSYYLEGNNAPITTGADSISFEFVGDHTGATTVNNNGSVVFEQNSGTSDRSCTVQVTVTVGELSASETASITQRGTLVTALTGISAIYNGNTKNVGDSISASDFTVTGHYLDLSEKTLENDITISPSTLTSVGNNTINVYYKTSIATTTVSVPAYDYITAVEYSSPNRNNTTYFKSIPTITNSQTVDYNTYTNYINSSSYTTEYSFTKSAVANNALASFGTAETLDNLNFVIIGDGSVLDKGTLRYSVYNTLYNMTEGGVLVDEPVRIAVTKNGASEPNFVAEIANPVTTICTSTSDWASLTPTTISTKTGSCAGRSANSSGLTKYIPGTSYKASSSLNSYSYYEFTPQSSTKYLIINVSGDNISSINALITQRSTSPSSDTVNASISVINAVMLNLKGTFIYKLKTSGGTLGKVYIMFSGEHQVTFTIRELDAITAVLESGTAPYPGTPE